MAFVEVDRTRVSENAAHWCWHDGWKAIAAANEDFALANDDEYLAVYSNAAEVAGYAVYYKYRNDGELVCLLKRASDALALNPNDSFESKLLEVYKQEAIDEGFPEKRPKDKDEKPKTNRYTVRIQRIFDVEVRAVDEMQANQLGTKLARIAQTGSDWLINEALMPREYELEWVRPIEDEDMQYGYWDLSLSREQSERYLKGE